MSQKLISKMLSGKVVYSDKAHRTLGFQKLIFFTDTNYATMVAC